MNRFEYQKDTTDNCITLRDYQDKLKTSFDSEIILYPLEDAITVVNELNLMDKIINRLSRELTYNGYTTENIDEIIEEIEI